MKPVFVTGSVRAICPECGALTTFESRSGKGDHGSLVREWPRPPSQAPLPYHRTIYLLLRCAGCGRGGLAEIAAGNIVADGELVSFVPSAPVRAKLPPATPEEVVREVREAELCVAAGAHRAASAMLRSALEKVLKLNGFTKGNLKNKIDEASTDGLLTESRRSRAHQDVRCLGNDVLHDEWREVVQDEAETAHHYVQRVLEDFYDDRPTVEAALRAKNRLPP
jgi:hypothetical protein